MKYSIQKLASTKMTRQEFLTYLGVVVVGLVGIPSLISLLNDSNPQTKAKKITNYGTGPYGV